MSSLNVFNNQLGRVLEQRLDPCAKSLLTEIFSDDFFSLVTHTSQTLRESLGERKLGLWEILYFSLFPNTTQ